MKNFVDLIFASVILSICFYTCSCKPIFVDVDFVDADATVQNMFSKAQTETAVFDLALSKELTKQAPTLTDSTEYDQNISSAMTPEPGDFTEEELQEIRPLIDQIKENPDDPFPRFKLGITYLETDRPQLARDSFQNGFKLSEDNPQAILEIGDQLSDLNIWTYAAYSYLLVHKLGSPIPPEELQDKINEALYHAAFEDYSLEVLTNNNDIELDHARQKLMESRQALLKGKVDLAESLLSQAQAERPNMLEAYLLRSDILFTEENYDKARDQLLELEQNEDLPTWILIELGLNP